MSIRLTILGKSPSWQDTDGACSGYLIEADGYRLLMDCGNGVLAKLRQHAPYEAIDAVVVSHLHADHILDLVPFAYVLTYGPPAREGAAPLLHVPPGVRDGMRRLCGVFGNELLIEDAFDCSEYDPAAELAIGPLRARFQLVPHYVPTYAIELTDGDGRRIVFSADCGPNDELVEFARAAQLLLIEATLTEPDLEDHAHLTAEEAGEIGRRAGVERLLVTHFSADLGADQVRARAAEAFARPVEVAVAGARHDV
ncbi:MAG TPA: MBL fold metallo-hydrolase [Solirubrobacteraceae bacterium]|nr:MBL fold metallo-hydrolase [Solirubrobacteraceae bacterium]